MSDGVVPPLDQLSECGSDSSVATISSDSLNRTEVPDDRDNKSASEKIAKDTGCCLYSAITVIVIMTVSLGIVLIVTGPALGISLFSPSLLHHQDNRLHALDNQTISAKNESMDYDDWWDELVNGTTTEASEPLEDLGTLSPEALRIGPKGSYVAYVPIPVKEDEWDDGHEEDVGGHVQESNNSKNKVILPIVVIPDRTKSSNPSFNSWHSNDYTDHEEPRRFDEHITEFQNDPAPSFPARTKGVDYGMFGTLAPQQRPRYGGNRRQHRPKDDYGRTAVLGPPRSPPRQRNGGRRRRPPPNQPNRRGPNRYFRPPPPLNSHRIQTRYPEQWSATPHDFPGVPLRYHPSSSNDYRQDHAVTKKPLYSYPRDAMNIQDIISYMTSLGNSDAAPASSSNSDNRPAISRDSWVSPPSTQTSGASRVWHQQSRDSPSRPSPSQIRSKLPPYSFMLDVYPVKGDPGTSASNQNSASAPNIRTHSSSFNNRPGFSSADGIGNYAYNVRYVEDQLQQYRFTESPDGRRPTFINYADPSSFRDHLAEQNPVPIAFRPSSSHQFNRPVATPSSGDEDLASKPKLVVHLNVYNQKNQGAGGRLNKYDDDKVDEYDDYFYSPSDIYRAVLRNNASKRDQYLQAGEGEDDSTMTTDDGLPSGQSRISSVTHHISSELDAGISHHQPDSTQNHNMAAGFDLRSHGGNYRSIATSTNIGGTNQGNHYRPSNQIRNFNPMEDLPEPLPNPLPLSNSTSVETVGP